MTLLNSIGSIDILVNIRLATSLRAIPHSVHVAAKDKAEMSARHHGFLNVVHVNIPRVTRHPGPRQRLHPAITPMVSHLVPRDIVSQPTRPKRHPHYTRAVAGTLAIPGKGHTGGQFLWDDSEQIGIMFPAADVKTGQCYSWDITSTFRIVETLIGDTSPLANKFVQGIIDNPQKLLFRVNGYNLQPWNETLAKLATVVNRGHCQDVVILHDTLLSRIAALALKARLEKFLDDFITLNQANPQSHPYLKMSILFFSVSRHLKYSSPMISKHKSPT